MYPGPHTQHTYTFSTHIHRPAACGMPLQVLPPEEDRDLRASSSFKQTVTSAGLDNTPLFPHRSHAAPASTPVAATATTALTGAETAGAPIFPRIPLPQTAPFGLASAVAVVVHPAAASPPPPPPCPPPRNGFLPRTMSELN